MRSSSSARVIYPVHQLHPDPQLRNLDHRHDLTLIFFHGFSNGTDAWEKTWIQRGDPRVCWPRNWLHKDEEQEGLGDNILVLSISFDGNPDGAHKSVEEIGKNLLQSLVNNAKWNFHQDSQQIVLVGHSFGGLVIKSLMVEVDKAVKERSRSAIERNKQARCKAFQANVKGIMFYAVPHIGANKNFKTYLTACHNIPYLQNSTRLTGLMRSVDAFNRQMVDLSTNFEDSVPKDINLYAIVEGREVVVPKASAQILARNNVCVIEDANHMQVCQPVDKSHESYRRFLQFVKDIRNENQQVETFLQFAEDIRNANQQAMWDEMKKLEPMAELPPINDNFYPYGGPGTQLKQDLKQRLVTSEPQAASVGDSSVNMTGGLQENLKLEQLSSEATAISCLNPGSSSGSEVVDPVFVEKLDHEKPSGFSVTENWKIPNTCGQLFKQQKVTATTENIKVENKLSTCQIGHQEPQRNVILVAGRQDAGGDSVEFLFQTAENMARVVGVGFHWSKVVINRKYLVSIIRVGESAWSDLCNEVRTEATPHNDSNSFSLMSIEFLTMPTEQVDTLYNLTAQESSKRFGVGLEGSGLGVHVYAHDNNIQSGEDFPLIFSLLDRMGFKRENAKDLGKQHSGTSSSKATSSGNNTETSTKEEKCLPQQNQGPTKKNHGDNEDEESRHPPEDSGPKVTSLIVTVIPESGGTFHRRSTNDIEYPRDSIKLAAIAPLLEFKFEKSANYRKITTTTKTRCHLGGGEPKYPEVDSGYYQDNITISLTCEKEDAATLSFSEVTKTVSTKQTTAEPFTDSSSLARQTGGQIGGQVQIPVVGIGFQAQGNTNVTSTIGGSSSLAESEEISNTQFAGFNVNPADLEGSQVYNFLYCTDVLRLIQNNPAKFISAGICRTLSPTIVGEWDALDMDDACLYNFKTERDLMSIGDLMQSFASWKVPYMRQRYQVPFFINHAMTHIGAYGTTVLQGPGEQRLEKVLTKYPAIA